MQKQAARKQPIAKPTVQSNATPSELEITRALTNFYLVRPNVDGALEDALRLDRHVVICGNPERGKTSSYRRALGDSAYTVVSCKTGMRRYDVFRMLLAQMGVFLTTTRKRNRRRSKSASISLIVEKEGSQDVRLERTVDIDLSNINDVLRIAIQNQAPKTVVLERFEELPKRAIRGIARDLKIVFEQSDFRFVLIGIWTPDEAMHLLGSPFGTRYLCVHVEDWTVNELSSMLEDLLHGAGCLWEPAAVAEAVDEAAGCVGLLKEVATAVVRRSCQANKTYTDGGPLHMVTKDDVERTIDELVEAWLPSYQVLVESLSLRSSPLWNDKAHLSKWIMHSFLSTDVQQLREGLSIDFISKHINKVHPNAGKCFVDPRDFYLRDKTLEDAIGKPKKRGNPRHPFVVTPEQIMREAKLLRRAQRGRTYERPVMYYDARLQRIRVTDPRLLLILGRNSRNKLLEMLPVFDEESEDFEPMTEKEFVTLKRKMARNSTRVV
jgi:hypothetical protein